MVHGQHGIELPVSSPAKEAICRKRAGNVEAVCSGSLQRRLDDVDFLAADHPAISRMRIQAQYCNARLCNPKIANEAV